MVTAAGRTPASRVSISTRSATSSPLLRSCCAISKATKDQKKVEARLNLEHLDKLGAATGIPLVLHGGSGVRREDVLGGIRRGIAKINIGTEIRQAYEVAMKDSGQVTVAQEAVYQRTVTVIRDYFNNSGIRNQLAVL